MRLPALHAALFICLAFTTHAAGRGDVLAGVPLAFEPNLGQTSPSVKFLARAPGQSVFFTSSEIVLALHGGGGNAVLRLRLVGARGLRLEGTDLLPGRNHYFRGSDPKGWRTNIPTYARLRGRDVYPGVDAVFHGNQGRLEYDFVVAPGADPSRIRLSFQGARSITLEASGDLILTTPAGTLRQHRPVVCQVIEGRRHSVEGSYVIRDSGEIAFNLGPYDETRELIIDPVVSFSTFLGGSGLDDGRGIAVDQQGYIYVTGTTHSPDFPSTAGSLTPAYGVAQLLGDVFVTKMEPNGAAVRYSAFFGGNRADVASGIAVDAAGNAFIAGHTDSVDFPTTLGVHQSYHRSTGIRPDGFVAKLSPDGSRLLYSTFLGGNYTDRIHAIAIDAEGNAYVAGATDSSSFPTTAFAFRSGSCPSLGLGGFVTKLNASGTSLDYSTMLCGSSSDEVLGIDVDAGGRAFVTGYTRSADFPTTAGAWRTTGGGDNDEAFVTKLNSAGSSLIYSTFLGGSAADTATGIAVDGDGKAYVTGYTRSTDFPVTAGALQPAHADGGLFEDAFVAALSATGESLEHSTYLGGSANDRASGIALGAGGIHVTGHTASSDFPATPAPCQTGYGGGQDAFLTKLNTAGTGLSWSLFLGGLEHDRGHGVAVDQGGSVYVAGQTSSGNFPTTPAAFRTAYGLGYGGASDAFVARVDQQPALSAPCIALNGLVNGASFLPGPLAPGQIVSVFGAGLGPETPAVFRLNGSDVLDKALAGTRVLFDGIPAVIIATSTGQVNTIVPYSVAGKTRTVVQVEYQGVKTPELVLPVGDAAPAMFTLNSSGRGPGAILNQDYSVNTPANRAAKGSIVQIFATGEGQTNPPGVDGKVAIGGLPSPILLVSVTIGGLDAPVKYAGAAPGMVAGLIQVNAEVPGNVASGSAVPVVLTIGDNTSPRGVTVAIR